MVLAVDVGWRNGGARERRAVRVRRDMAARFEVEDLVR